MNYIIIICLSIGILHFVLYYLNIDPFQLSSKPKQNDYNNICNNGISNNGTSNNETSNNETSNNETSNNGTSNNGTSNNDTCAKDIEESINELKKLNEYIDNESRPIT